MGNRDEKKSKVRAKEEEIQKEACRGIGTRRKVR